MKKLEISQYNDFLNNFKIDELTCEIHVIKNVGLSFEEMDERNMNHLKSGQNIIDMKSSTPVWKISGKRIGIWKQTPTVKINDIKSLRYMLHRTYGNFGFERSTSKCFGLNTYTGIVRIALLNINYIYF